MWIIEDIDLVNTEMEDLMTEDNLVRQMHASLLRRVLGIPSLKNSLIMCAVLNVSQQLCGINTVSSCTF